MPKELTETTTDDGQGRQVGVPTESRKGNSRNIKKSRYRFIQITQAKKVDLHKFLYF